MTLVRIFPNLYTLLKVIIKHIIRKLMQRALFWYQNQRGGGGGGGEGQQSYAPLHKISSYGQLITVNFGDFYILQEKKPWPYLHLQLCGIAFLINYAINSGGGGGGGGGEREECKVNKLGGKSQGRTPLYTSWSTFKSLTTTNKNLCSKMRTATITDRSVVSTTLHNYSINIREFQ